MPSLSPSGPRPAPVFASIAVFIYGTFWRVALLVICLPLWLGGLCLVRIGYASIDLGYIIRDKLEDTGKRLEAT